MNKSNTFKAGAGLIPLQYNKSEGKKDSWVCGIQRQLLKNSRVTDVRRREMSNLERYHSGEKASKLYIFGLQ